MVIVVALFVCYNLLKKKVINLPVLWRIHEKRWGMEDDRPFSENISPWRGAEMLTGLGGSNFRLDVSQAHWDFFHYWRFLAVQEDAPWKDSPYYPGRQFPQFACGQVGFFVHRCRMFVGNSSRNILSQANEIRPILLTVFAILSLTSCDK